MRLIDYYCDLSNYTTEARGQVDMIYLHWTAGRYGQHFGDYHLNIDSDGSIWTDMNSFTDFKEHTWHRNSGAIGIAIDACYGASIDTEGNITYGDYPPTQAQMEGLIKVVAKVAYEIGIPVSNILTHAEVADIDGYGLHDSDPDMRWDLYGQGWLIRQKVQEQIDEWNNG